MKIFAIGDLHLDSQVNKPMEVFGDNWLNHFEKIKIDWNNKVKNEDVVVVCGDISWAMKLEDAIPDLEELKNLNGIKIIVRGNHDYWWQSLSKVRQTLGNNFYALQNDSIKIGNNIFCGTRGWSVPEKSFESKEDKKIYDREVLRVEMALKNAQSKITDLSDKIILVLHYPPYNSNFSNNEFLDLINQYNVHSVIFGHIHSNYSQKLINKINNTKFYLTSCDLLNFKLIEIQ